VVPATDSLGRKGIRPILTGIFTSLGLFQSSACSIPLTYPRSDPQSLVFSALRVNVTSGAFTVLFGESEGSEEPSKVPGEQLLDGVHGGGKRGRLLMVGTRLDVRGILQGLGSSFTLRWRIQEELNVLVEKVISKDAGRHERNELRRYTYNWDKTRLA